MSIYSSEKAAELTGRAQVTVTAIAKRSHESADPADHIGHKLGDAPNSPWVFDDSDLEKIRNINPLGGRPRQDGQPPRYTKAVEDVVKGRPPKEEEGQ